MQKGRTPKRLCALALALLLAAAPAAHAETGTAPTAEPTAASQTSLKDLQAQRDAAQQKLDAINDTIKDLKNRKSAAQQLKAQYQQQQQTLKETIELINQQIDELEALIAQKEVELTQKQAEFDARWAGFKERMAAMQMLNDGGSIALLSSVTNLYELLTFPQTLEDIAAKDQSVLSDLDRQREELETLKAEYTASQQELQTRQTELESKVQELAASIQAQNAKISEADAQQQAAEEAKIDIEKAFDDATAAIQSYLAAQNSKYNSPELYCSLNFGYPIAHYSYISNGYGTRGTNNWRTNPHGGSDLVASEGTEIYAAADGIVTAAGWNSGGYGNYVMILHGTADDGNTYVTLYGHMMQTPSVREGQSVTRGQLIGYVGHTGSVRGNPGNHLHLELRINGVRTDPTKYIPLP